ncbi:MAG: hypothetical protein R3B06_24270 [Kofleriaceae bacterium]
MSDRNPDDLTEHELIYDWNAVDKVGALSPKRKVTFLDETLRDGIQSPSVVDPSIDDKLRLIDLASDLGIHYIDIGLPGAGRRAIEDCTTIAEHARDAGLPIKLACAARTHEHDVQAVVDISQRVGVEIEVLTFIGSSPIRQYAENWDLAKMLDLSAKAIDLGRRYNLPVAYVTEDTTRSRPEVLAKLFVNAVEHGAHRLIVCDTVGHATPDGIKHLLRFTRNLLDGMGRPDVGIDWHGHNDRGLGVVNSIFAHRVRRRSHPRHRAGHRRARRQRRARPDPAQPGALGRGARAGSVQAAPVVPDGGARHPRADPRPVPAGRRRRVPHRHRRPRGGDHQGREEGPRLAGRSHLLGRPGRAVRARAGDRGRALLG